VFTRRTFASLVALLALGASSCGSSASSSDTDAAIKAAHEAYAKAAAAGEDLASGPCIAENVPNLPDWVVDIAHDPRTPVDDDPANECERYRDGQAHHFVELTPQGKLIRTD
jgi:hypothetical protein